jgi:hypothetical protein
VILELLPFLSAQVVEHVFEAQEERPHQHYCARSFKWNHRVGMIHCIARYGNPKDYGTVVTVALRAQMSMFCERTTRNRAVSTKDCRRSDIECWLGDYLHFASNP